jgi:F-type H+-transporting ATPase subunit alpha
VEAVSEYERQMLEFMESKHADLLSEIKEKAKIDDELEEKLKKALDEFKTVFQPPA